MRRTKFQYFFLGVFATLLLELFGLLIYKFYNLPYHIRVEKLIYTTSNVERFVESLIMPLGELQTFDEDNNIRQDWDENFEFRAKFSNSAHFF